MGFSIGNQRFKTCVSCESIFGGKLYPELVLMLDKSRIEDGR